MSFYDRYNLNRHRYDNYRSRFSNHDRKTYHSDKQTNSKNISTKKNKVFAFVLFAMYVVALLMNIINISSHDYGTDTDNKRMKDILNIVSVFGFGFSLVFITFSAVDKEWFYLTYFITLIFFVFGILVKRDKDGALYPSRTIFTLSQ